MSPLWFKISLALALSSCCSDVHATLAPSSTSWRTQKHRSSHWCTWATMPLCTIHTEKRGCSDPSPAAAEAATQTGAPLYATSADLLRDVAAKKLSLDMGFVCTPTHLHVPQALELIEHGVHVFVEKPFAVDSESGKRVIQAAQEAKVKLVVGHHRRHNPHLKMVRAVRQPCSGEVTARPD